MAEELKYSEKQISANLKIESEIRELFKEAKSNWYNIESTDQATDKQILNEVNEKFDQLEWIFERVVSLEHAQYRIFDNVVDENGLPIPVSTEDSGKLEEWTREERILTEAFYYISWRVAGILRYKFKGFEKKIPGVDNVRNKLIEHPWDKDSKVFINSFGSCGPKGPVIKSVRYSHQKDIYPDQGFYANLIEFLEAIINLH